MINSFTSNYAFLSNFYECNIIYDYVMWPSVEHLYQALKSLNPDEREFIRQQSSPGLAKKAGRRITLRSDWESVKDDIMLTCLILKFSQGKLKQKLLETGNNELIENNYWYDNYWGNCSCQKCKNIIGKNMLGNLLMQVRDEICYSNDYDIDYSR